MKAVIMAGGKGTRLRPLTCSLPKPMAQVAARPMMEHVVDLLLANGITDLACTLCFLPDEVRTHFGDGSRFGCSIQYSVETTPGHRRQRQAYAASLTARSSWPAVTPSPT